MFYESEMRLFCNTLKKLHVNSSYVSPDDSITKIIEPAFSILIPSLDQTNSIKDFFGDLTSQTIYKFTLSGKIFFTMFLLPNSEKKTIFFFGPYLSAHLSRSQIMEIWEAAKIYPKDQKFVERLIMSIPILPDSAHLFVMLDSLGEILWDGASNFTVTDVRSELTAPDISINEKKTLEDPDTLLINMQMMEQRYQYENEMMDAVEHGQYRKLGTFVSAFGDTLFEKRVADPLRNAKNYCIIMNTLLRKAAQKANVHPLYLDSLSSSFAMKIEQLSSPADTHEFMSDMFSSYCRLVRKHSMKNYSQTVQKTILIIEADLSANLTLSSLALAQKVSPGYLSTIFKRETGKTVTEYIAEKRIRRASQLLATTHLQIQTVALHCGIMDVQYFSKLFKKKTGKTPKEYRASVKS